MVTADHGISLRPDDELRTATRTNIGEIAGVPLFIKAPGQERGRVDDSPVRTVDVVPTIAADLDLKPRWRPDGESLASGVRPQRPSVRVLTVYGDLTTVPFDRFVAARDAATAHIRATFGAGVAGLFELGPDGGLVGSRADRLRVVSGTEARVELDDPQVVAQVDPGQSVLPISVSGQVIGAGPGPWRLALVLNGRVSAVTSAYNDRGAIVFTGLLRPGDLRAGANSLGVFEIRGRPPDVTLVPLLHQVQFELEERAGSPVIVGRGREIAVDPDAAEGYLERVQGKEGRLMFASGWAVTSRKTPVDEVLLFAGDRFVSASKPSGNREDVVAHFHAPSALKSGYQLPVPPGALEGESQDSLHAYAVTGNRATELQRSGG